MPTLEQLRITHRYAERSVAQYVGIPDEITEEERCEFLKLQQEYEDLTRTGLKDRWLGKPRFAVGPVGVMPGNTHPTRTVIADEPDETYEPRIKFLDNRIGADVQRTIDKLTDACKTIREHTGIVTPLDLAGIRQRMHAEAEDRWGAPKKRERRQISQPAPLTEAETVVRNALATQWVTLQSRGLAEGWLITKAHIVVPHPLDHHPHRTVATLEAAAVVAARVTGLDAYLAARVTN